MTVRLRPHHLLCMLTYAGEGYSRRFVVNYDKVLRRVQAGEEIQIVDGPDDICQPLLQEETSPHCHNESVGLRDLAAMAAVEHLLGQGLAGAKTLVLTPDLLEKLRAGFLSGELRPACSGCEWSSTCDRISTDGFAGVRLNFAC